MFQGEAAGGAYIQGTFSGESLAATEWRWRPGRGYPDWLADWLDDADRRAWRGRFHVVSGEESGEDGRPLILAVARHEPTAVQQVAWIDPLSGEELFSFWHRGRLARRLILPGEGPGEGLVLFTGLALDAPLAPEHEPPVCVLALPLDPDPELRLGWSPRFPFDPEGARQVERLWEVLEPLTGGFRKDGSRKSFMAQQRGAQRYLELVEGGVPREIFARRAPLDPGRGYRWMAIVPLVDPYFRHEASPPMLTLFGEAEGLQLLVADQRRYLLDIEGRDWLALFSLNDSWFSPIGENVGRDYGPVLLGPPAEPGRPARMR
jgi:hypothetical protein